MNTIDRINHLLNEYGYTQKDLTDYLGIPKSVFSAWKNGKSKSYNKYLNKIAKFFNLGVEDITIYERKEAAIQRHGFFYDAVEREAIKADARRKISSGMLDDEEMIRNAILIFEALFSRDLEAHKFSPTYDCFDVYCARLLNQGKNQRLIFGTLSDEKYNMLYNALVSKFGVQEGISKGTHYPFEEDLDVQITKKIRTLNRSGKEEVLKRISELSRLSEYCNGVD